MKRLFLSTLVLCATFFFILFTPLSLIFADNIYQNELYDFSFRIDEDWKLKTKKDLENLSPKDKDELIESLRNVKKDSHLFIRLKGKKSDEYKNYKKIKDKYIEASENEKYRLTRPLTTLYGFNVDKVKIDKDKLVLQLQGNDGNGRILKEFLWVPINDDELLEIEHIHTSKSFSTRNSDSVQDTVFSSFKLSKDSGEGTVEVITKKDRSELEKRATEVFEEFDLGEFMTDLLDSINLTTSIVLFSFSILLSSLFFFSRS